MMKFLQGKSVELFGIRIHALTRNEAVGACISLLGSNAPGCRYVVTPNVNHVVRLQHDALLRQAYDRAALVLADGNPVVWASKLLGQPLPSIVPGSDLVPDILGYWCARDNPRLKVYLLGAGPGVAEVAARKIQRVYPKVEVVGMYSPPFGFENSPAENDKMVKLINSSGAQLLVLGLGMPKQELWISENAEQLSVSLAVCAGAVIDFIAGEKPRAPVWVRKMALEWLFRMLTEPTRLTSRYLRDGLAFPKIVYREVKKVRRTRGEQES